MNVADHYDSDSPKEQWELFPIGGVGRDECAGMGAKALEKRKSLLGLKITKHPKPTGVLLHRAIHIFFGHRIRICHALQAFFAQMSVAFGSSPGGQWQCAII